MHSRVALAALAATAACAGGFALTPLGVASHAGTDGPANLRGSTSEVVAPKVDGPAPPGFHKMIASMSADSPASTMCDKTLLAAGVSPAFPGVVAHGIHAMTVSSLRIFNRDVGAANGVPVINPDLSAEDAVLMNAPDDASELAKCPFETATLCTVDGVLNHMHDGSYDIRGYTALERLVHLFHMQDIWRMALPVYLELPMPEPHICACATDVRANGVLDNLEFTALMVREPKLMDHKSIAIHGKTYTWEGPRYTFNFISDSPFLPLDQPGGWDSWKTAMTSMTKEHLRDLALYLRCQLAK